MKHIPFDLDKALNGHPVIFLDTVDDVLTPVKATISKSAVLDDTYIIETKYSFIRLSSSDLNSYVVGMWAAPLPMFFHWDFLSPKINALAMDSDGTWHCYSAAPKMVNDNRKKTKHKDGGWWYSSGGYRMEVLLHPDMLPTCAKENWRHSLILRPGYEEETD